jgi:TPR repeat protein
MGVLIGLRRQGLRLLCGSALLGLVAVPAVAAAAPSDAETLRKLTALAEQGSATAQYNVGMFHNNGIGTAKDPRAAFRWFERAAAGGDALGSYKVGCYYAGQFSGVVEVDEVKALTAKTVAAEAGYALAQSDVAAIHARRADLGQATKWWSRAATQGYPQAMMNLSEAYRRGQGVPKDAGKALQLMLQLRRIAPEPARERLESMISDLKREAGPERAAQAEKTVAAWSPVVSPLTSRARRGIEEAQALVD